MMDTRRLLVADVMSLDPVVVACDASIEEAAGLLQANSISGLPVVDGAGALVGVISQSDRGVHRTLTREARLPIDEDFSWGLIRIVDRLHVTNEYLTFGGRLRADEVDDVVVFVFSSPAPLLRRGGHSQAWDPGADSLGAYFGRFLLAIDYAPGFETRAARADPVTRYAAFVADEMARYRAGPILRTHESELWQVLRSEEHRLQATHPDEWAAGVALRRDAVNEERPAHRSADAVLSGEALGNAPQQT